MGLTKPPDSPPENFNKRTFRKEDIHVLVLNNTKKKTLKYYLFQIGLRWYITIGLTVLEWGHQKTKPSSLLYEKK